jgi:hypothetical protein
MILRQLLHTHPLIAASYIVGCGGKTAAIVTEARFVAAMLRDIPPAPPNAAATRAENLGLAPAVV